MGGSLSLRSLHIALSAAFCPALLAQAHTHTCQWATVAVCSAHKRTVYQRFPTTGFWPLQQDTGWLTEAVRRKIGIGKRKNVSRHTCETGREISRRHNPKKQTNWLLFFIYIWYTAPTVNGWRALWLVGTCAIHFCFTTSCKISMHIKHTAACCDTVSSDVSSVCFINIANLHVCKKDFIYIIYIISKDMGSCAKQQKIPCHNNSRLLTFYHN